MNISGTLRNNIGSRIIQNLGLWVCSLCSDLSFGLSVFWRWASLVLLVRISGNALAVVIRIGFLGCCSVAEENLGSKEV